MKRRGLIALTVTALGSVLLPGATVGQHRPTCETMGVAGPLPNSVVKGCESLKQQLVGSWTLDAYERVSGDGRVQLMGEHAQGMLILDHSGYFTLILARSDLPDVPLNLYFPDTDRGKETAEDAKSIVDGMRTLYGTFQVTNNGYSRTLEFFPDFAVGSHRRLSIRGDVKSLTNEGFELGISLPFGKYIRLAWRRAR